MTVFDVFMNGKKLCRAGVGDDGVLDAIVSWVKLTGEAAQTARRLKKPVEEARLHVGGLSQGTHRRWPARRLKVGDRVTVAVRAATRFDPPVRERPENPELQAEQEKRYYLHLKQKYEGRAPESQTTFLNVDLDIYSASPLDALATAFGKQVAVLHVGKTGARYAARLELAAGTRAADATIRRFVTLVEQLPRPARALWNRARVRELNIGIQAGTPHAYELQLKPATLRAAARISAQLGFTVYGLPTSGPVPADRALPDRSSAETRRTRGRRRKTARG